MPWLEGFAPIAASDTPSATATERMSPWSVDDDVTPEGGIELAADVAREDGIETIAASYAGGIVVLDRDGHLLARAAGFPSSGSADELLSIATGSAFGDPMIAIATTSGGHRASETRLTLYRFARPKLERLFDAVVAERDGSLERHGRVALVPGGLIYRAPSGATTLWRLVSGGHGFELARQQQRSGS